MKHGYVLLSRRILDHPIVGEANMEYMAAWNSILLRANYSTTEEWVNGAMQKLGRGQFSIPIRTLAEYWSWSPGKVQRYLKILVRAGMLKRVTRGTHDSVLEVINYDAWQTPGHHYDTGPDSPMSQEKTSIGYVYKEENKKKENTHLTREMPVFGLTPETFEMKDGRLIIPDPKELNRWEEIFGNYAALSIALAGFTPDAEYRHGNSLDKHARHYLSNKASQTNRRVAPRPSLADKFR